MDNINELIKKMKTKVTLTLMNLKNLPIEKKVGYISATLICTLFLGLTIYLIYRFRSFIWALTTLLVLVYFNWYDNKKNNASNFYLDIDSVRHCCFEMIRDTALIFDWSIPINEKNIDRYFVSRSDKMERYYFRVWKKKFLPSDISIYEARQIINDDLEHQYHLNQTTFFSPLTGLYLDDYIDRGTYVDMSVIPRNPSTYEYILQKESHYAHEHEKEQKPTESTVTEYSKQIPRPFVRKDILERYHRIVTIAQDLDLFPHILCIGNTGSGKTYGMKLLTGHILHAYANENCQLYLGDWKGQDYDFLKNCKNYYPHDLYADALQQFYEKLENRIAGRDKSTNRCLLVLDEWNNFLSSLPTSKEQNNYIRLLSYCLNMGRSYKMNILLGSQTGHAEFFGKSRDSFCTVVGLGQLSKEAKLMLFRDSQDIIVPQPRGCGYLLQDGHQIHNIMIPTVKDMTKLQQILISAADT